MDTEIRYYEKWWTLAKKACESTNKEEKFKLLKEASEEDMSESWPLIHLAELEEDIVEKIKLYIRSIKIDNSHYSYIKMFYIMMEKGYKNDLLIEINNINIDEIKDLDIRNNILNIKKHLYLITYKKEESISKYIEEFLMLPSFNKPQGIRIKCAMIPRDIKCILDYNISEGKVIIKYDRAKYLVINNESLRVFDFVVSMKDELILGYEHTFMTGKSYYVKAAGILGLEEDGTAVFLSNWSGHYKPTVKESLDFENMLNNFGIDTKKCNVDIRDYSSWGDFVG